MAAMLLLFTLSAGCSSDDPVAPDNQAPVATIDSPAQDTSVTLGDAVDFLGTASDPDGTVASHTWSFGDGNGAVVEDPGSHTYSAEGTFPVTYEVTDNNGATSVPASVTITVVELSPIQGSTWRVESNDFTAKGISDFLMTFDQNSTDVTRIQYSFNGTGYDYDAAQITGAGAAVGTSVDINVEWNGDSSFEFDGILTSGRDQAVGTIVYGIIEGGESAAGVDDATLTRQ